MKEGGGADRSAKNRKECSPPETTEKGVGAQVYMAISSLLCQAMQWQRLAFMAAESCSIWVYVRVNL